MSGFLSRLDKKGQKSSSLPSDLLVQSSSAAKGGGSASSRSGNAKAESGAPKEPLKVITGDTNLGTSEALFASLQSEGKKLRERSPEPSTVPPTSTAPASVEEKGKIIKTQESPAPKKKNDIFNEKLPWWLTEPTKSSPQVDTLVPAARLALNDLIADKTNITREEMAESIRRAVTIAADQLSSETRFSSKDISDAIQEVISLMLGKGPLQSLYDDPSVTDIYLDGHDSIKCMRRGQALETPFRFRSPSEYEAYTTNMLQSVERVLNLTSPIVDCVLNDQWRSRLNAVHSSLLDGAEASIVIRVPRLQQVSFYDLLRTKTLPATLAAWLAELVSCGEANIMVMGPTGSGKTTLTTALLSAVGSDERICTIEDVPEIFVPTTHLEKLVSRPENSQGEGAIGMEKLLRAALRRAPHRIVVGEIRDREGPLFLKALETGHAGSVATIHADNPRDGLWRLLDVVAAFEHSPQESIQRRIARSLHVLISMKRIGGRPCLTDISEVLPPVNGEFVVKQIVRYDSEIGGRRHWRIASAHSLWLDKLAARGMELQAGPALLPLEKVTEKPKDFEG